MVEVAAADGQTAFRVQDLLAAQCAIAPADRTTREPGEPGVTRTPHILLKFTPHMIKHVLMNLTNRRDQGPGTKGGSCHSDLAWALPPPPSTAHLRSRRQAVHHNVGVTGRKVAVRRPAWNNGPVATTTGPVHHRRWHQF
ncbi:DUF6207 family protein [Streptomyces massasporeus]